MPRRRLELWLYSFFNLDIRTVLVDNATPRPLDPHGKHSVPLV